MFATYVLVLSGRAGVDMGMSTNESELRIRRNRARRKRELRRRMAAGILLFVLTASSSLLFFSFRAKAQSSDEAMYKYYKSTVVKSGDTLWDFAEEYGESKYYDSKQDYVREVMLMNGLENDRITAGQYIILPYYSAEFVG